MTHEPPHIRHVTAAWHDIFSLDSLEDDMRAQAAKSSPSERVAHDRSSIHADWCFSGELEECSCGVAVLRKVAWARVCEHWVEYDAPALETPTGVKVIQRVTVNLRDGTQAVAPEPDADGQLRQRSVRSYVGLVLEAGEVQLQLRGRINVDGGRIKIEVDP